ncbi:hypothetical protein LCGC14_2391670 [marine sediment metagenome]|uniref:Uncharacterized protein n=1 Tax=marine sediment metagenome TaxID=412755 RepID=A0A0F9EAC6_9ZZZZ
MSVLGSANGTGAEGPPLSSQALDGRANFRLLDVVEDVDGSEGGGQDKADLAAAGFLVVLHGLPDGVGVQVGPGGGQPEPRQEGFDALGIGGGQQPARDGEPAFGLQAPEEGKFSAGDTVRIFRLDDELTLPELIGVVGQIEEVDPLPNGEFNYYVNGHYMHEGELENVEKE